MVQSTRKDSQFTTRHKTKFKRNRTKKLNHQNNLIHRERMKAKINRRIVACCRRQYRIKCLAREMKDNRCC